MKFKKVFSVKALHIFVLCSFAFAQPLFDLLSRNAEFFVARHSQPIDVILLILILCILLPALLVLVEVVAGLFGQRLHKIAHYFIMACLIAVIALPVLKKIAGLPGTALLVMVVMLGVVVTITYIRFHFVRIFMTVLSPALLLFPCIFLFYSPVYKVVFPEKDPSAVTIKVDNPPPIIMVVFDELPVTSLMDEHRQINPIRYPNFAALAQDSYWFRNATTVGSFTDFAIPAILTGKYPALSGNHLPTAVDYPNNLFTLLGGAYDLKGFESITRLCPDRLCGDNSAHESLDNRMRSLFSDLSAVYFHIILPDDLTLGLPVITQNWKDFYNDSKVTAIESEKDTKNKKRKVPDRLDQFNKFLDSIYSTSQPSLFFLHTLLPHKPWQFFPSGMQYGVNFRIDCLLENKKWCDDKWLVVQGFQRHLLQVGFVDKLLGEFIDRLKDVSLYDRSLIIVTADHGTSFQTNESRRFLFKTNYQDIIPVPLFIKLPDQHKRIISDRNVELIDILPTIADILKIEIPWPVDGRSVFDTTMQERKEKIVIKRAPIKHAPDSNGERLVFESLIVAKYDTLKRKLSLFGDGTNPDSLFKIGIHNNLIGRRSNEVGVVGETKAEIELDQAALFADVDMESNFLPSIIRGHVYPLEEPAVPLNLAIAINGTIRAVPQSFKKGKSGLEFSAIVPENSFQNGRNDVEVFVVSELDGLLRLKSTVSKSAVTYTLTAPNRQGSETIISSEGKTFQVIQGALSGHVDRTYRKDDILMFWGWAADVKNARLPEAIVIFVNGEFFYSGQCYTFRPDISQAFGKAALRGAGYHFVLPLTRLEDTSNMELRFFALSKEGMASELIYHQGYKFSR